MAELTIKVTDTMINVRERVCLGINMREHTRGIGKMIVRKVLENQPGETGIGIKAAFMMGRQKGGEHSTMLPVVGLCLAISEEERRLYHLVQ